MISNRLAFLSMVALTACGQPSVPSETDDTQQQSMTGGDIIEVDGGHEDLDASLLFRPLTSPRSPTRWKDWQHPDLNMRLILDAAPNEQLIGTPFPPRHLSR